MEARTYIGIAFIVVGTTLIPIGWMFSPVAAAIGFAAFVGGVVIFLTKQSIEKLEEAKFATSGKEGSGVPTDVHDHSGWGSGGRSEGWKSSSDSAGGGNDGGD